MAVSKQLATASLFIEIENGVDSTGAAAYKKKSFSGVKPEAAPENVFNVAEAIKAVLSTGTRDSYLNETSKLINA
jgi:hypothetical protein